MHFNLLSTEVKKEYCREYVFRLIVVLLGLLTILGLFGAAIFLPTYLLLSAKNESLEKQHLFLDELLKREGGNELLRELALTKEMMALIQTPLGAPVQSFIREIVVNKPQGISINSFAFDEEVTKQFSLRVSGEATTRDTLLAFKGVLSKLPFAGEVDLPISYLAESRDVTFVLTIKGKILQ